MSQVATRPAHFEIENASNISPWVLNVIKSKQPFTDKDFLPGDSSLYHQEEGGNKFVEKQLYQWKRASEIIGAGVKLFENGIEPNDVIQGKLSNW